AATAPLQTSGEILSEGGARVSAPRSGPGCRSCELLRHGDELLELLQCAAAIDRQPRELDAVAQRRCAAGDIERGARIRDDDFANRPLLAAQHSPRDPRVLRGVAAGDRLE